MLLTVSEQAKTWLAGLLHWLSKTLEKKKLKTRTHKTEKGQRKWQRSSLMITNWIMCSWLVYFNTFRNKLSVPRTVMTFFFYLMCNETTIRFGFCNVQNTVMQVWLSVISLILGLQLITLNSTLVILDITKTSTNNNNNNNNVYCDYCDIWIACRIQD